jgi:hypothetical protein
MIHSYDDWDKRVRAEYRSAEDNIVSMYADWTADREQEWKRGEMALAEQERDTDYQRRHRKWALKEARWCRDAEREASILLDRANRRAEAAEAERDKLAEILKATQWGLGRQTETGLKLAERVRVLEEALREMLDHSGDAICGTCARARAALSESSTKMEEEK